MMTPCDGCGTVYRTYTKNDGRKLCNPCRFANPSIAALRRRIRQGKVVLVKLPPTGEERRRRERQALIEDVQFLLGPWGGHQHPEVVAQRVGRNPSTVARVLRSAGLHDLAVGFDALNRDSRAAS